MSFDHHWRFDEDDDRDEDRAARQLCPKCRRGFQVLADEAGQHACPHCGYGGEQDDEDTEEPEAES